MFDRPTLQPVQGRINAVAWQFTAHVLRSATDAARKSGPETSNQHEITLKSGSNRPNERFCDPFRKGQAQRGQGRAGPDAVPDNPGEVFANRAYRGNHFRDAVWSKGDTLRVAATPIWERDGQATLA